MRTQREIHHLKEKRYKLKNLIFFSFLFYFSLAHWQQYIESDMESMVIKISLNDGCSE